VTIATVDELETGLTSRFSRYICNKTDPGAGNNVAGQYHSYWLGTGVPTNGAAPGATAVAFTNLTTGAMNFRQMGSSLGSYLAQFSASCTIANQTIEIHDKLIGMSALIGNPATPFIQTITGLDLSLFLAGNNIANRIGEANYSDVQWWVEWYADTRATAAVATINVTYDDGTTGDLTTIAAFGRRIGKMLPLNNLIPAANSGKYIRGINTITLSASTGTAGNFGFTATRYRGAIFVPEINKMFKAGWTETGFPQIYDSSCLFPLAISQGTALGVARLDGLIVHG